MTNDKLLKRAVTLLESVLSQGDEPDELQIEILAFLTKNGFRNELPETSSDFSNLTKKEFMEQVRIDSYGNSGYGLFFDWQQKWDENGTYLYGGYRFMVAVSKSQSTKKMLIDAAYKWITGKEQTVPYFMESTYAATDAKRFKIPISMSFNEYTENTKYTYAKI